MATSYYVATFYAGSYSLCRCGNNYTVSVFTQRKLKGTLFGMVVIKVKSKSCNKPRQRKNTFKNSKPGKL